MPVTAKMSSLTTHEARGTGVQHLWKEEGFPSSEVATLVCQAADPMTPPMVRARCLQSLTTCLKKWALEPIGDLWPTEEVESDSKDEMEESISEVRQEEASDEEDRKRKRC